MNYWQIAAGEGVRDYSNVFLKFGIMLMGSGSPGPYFENKASYLGYHDWRARVVDFAERAKKGDIVILKKPQHQEWEVQAVGRIIGDYEYIDQFDDVEGWNIPHCRKVEWVCPENSEVKLSVKGLTRGTFKAVHQSDVINRAKSFLDEGKKFPVSEIPPDAKRMSDEDLIESLIDNGLRPDESERVIETIWRVRRLARWYVRHGEDISEYETRTFLIVPILLALGWSEQRIKIEWKKMDIAFFKGVYGKNESPCMILESKRMWEGLSYAKGQAENYAKLYPKCSRSVVSDGMCYRLYEKENNSWVWKAYMNLLRLRDAHPYEKGITGAAQLFVNLMPK